MAISKERCAELEQLFLNLILECARDGIKLAGLWRQLLDPWYAYYRGPAFVRPRAETPVTFNPTDLLKYRTVVEAVPFSVEALALWRAGRYDSVKREHTVPIAVLRDLLISAAKGGMGRDNLRRILIENFAIVFVSKEEDDRLKPYNSRMPIGWELGDNKFARYHAQGIAVTE